MYTQALIVPLELNQMCIPFTDKDTETCLYLLRIFQRIIEINNLKIKS